MPTLRELREQLEDQILSPFAARSAFSRGREREEEPCAIRTAFQRDRDRVVHCKAFRRLADKTQVFIAAEGDHYRTRLTHTLEVAQIGRTMARALRLNEDLTEAIALAHDLGHTPFGHAGEAALDAAYRSYDPEAGFHHAEQSLRVVEVLEKDWAGLNLTWEVRDGIRHHSKGMDDFPRAEEGGPATQEAWVVLYSDRIAYINHDIDDAVRAGIITTEQLPEAYVAVLGRTHGQRITTMVTDLVTHSQERPAIAMGEEVMEATDGLKDFLFAHVYQRANATGGENARVQRTIHSLFEFYMVRPEEFPGGPGGGGAGEPRAGASGVRSPGGDDGPIRESTTDGALLATTVARGSGDATRAALLCPREQQHRRRDVSWEVAPRTFHRLGLICAFGWLALVGGSRWGLAAEDRSGVHLVKQQDGYTVTAPGYQAAIGLDGNLHSFRIGDVQMLDDKVGASLGCFFYSTAPLKLPHLVEPERATLEASDRGRYVVRYKFGPSRITLTLINRSSAPASYFVVLSPDITIVRNARSGDAAAAPANVRWEDASFYTRQGEFLTLRGGDRVWSWLDRQVWRSPTCRRTARKLRSCWRGARGRRRRRPWSSYWDCG